MPDAKLRHAIAFEAARLMYERTESEYFTAKRKAAARVCRGSVKPSDLPSNAEIRASCIVGANLLSPWTPRSIDELTPEHFAPVFALEPERAHVMLERVLKILFVTFLALCISLTSRSRPKSPLKSRQTECTWFAAFWVLSNSTRNVGPWIR